MDCKYHMEVYISVYIYYSTKKLHKTSHSAKSIGCQFWNLLSHFLTSIMEETPVVQPHQVRYQVRFILEKKKKILFATSVVSYIRNKETPNIAVFIIVWMQKCYNYSLKSIDHTI